MKGGMKPEREKILWCTGNVARMPEEAMEIEAECRSSVAGGRLGWAGMRSRLAVYQFALFVPAAFSPGQALIGGTRLFLCMHHVTLHVVPVFNGYQKLCRRSRQKFLSVAHGTGSEAEAMIVHIDV